MDNGSTADYGVLPSASTMETASNTPLASNNVSQSIVNQYPNNNYNYLQTSSVQYNDGSIGFLEIPRLDIAVKVYEGETLESMKYGAGHFEFTSAWDGNIGVAGHNRGSSGYFEGVKNLRNGDEIIYSTKYGTRYYKVVTKEKISDTDYSWLGWTSDNRITLVTCVEGSPSQRWCIQAVER